MDYKADLDEAMRLKITYLKNTYKTYALLWEKCAKAIKNKISSRLDYYSSIYNNPIALLILIKE